MASDPLVGDPRLILATLATLAIRAGRRFVTRFGAWHGGAGIHVGSNVNLSSREDSPVLPEPDPADPSAPGDAPPLVLDPLLTCPECGAGPDDCACALEPDMLYPGEELP